MTKPCDLFNLFDMPNGSKCRASWKQVRDLLHPAQEAVGYAAVQRKVLKDFQTKEDANKKSVNLPFVLGPKGVMYLVDSHHTASALEASGFHSAQVNLEKICDWSAMEAADFYNNMQAANFMMGTGRPDHIDALPVPVDVTKAIPKTVPELKDDSWRSLAALVRKVKDNTICPKENDKCLRGYLRDCQEDGRMTPFFEFRWAYFMNDAYKQGCGGASSFWDSESECRQFSAVYEKLTSKPGGILDQDSKLWQEAAKLLVPLCRGKTAQSYQIPESLGRPMGGEPLPGRVEGKTTPIMKKDPDCAAPMCPKLPPIATCTLNSTSEATSSSVSPPQRSVPSAMQWATWVWLAAVVAILSRLLVVKLTRKPQNYNLVDPQSAQEQKQSETSDRKKMKLN